MKKNRQFKTIGIYTKEEREYRESCWDYYNNYKGQKCHHSTFSVRISKGLTKEKALLPNKITCNK